MVVWERNVLEDLGKELLKTDKEYLDASISNHMWASSSNFLNFREIADRAMCLV